MTQRSFPYALLLAAPLWAQADTAPLKYTEFSWRAALITPPDAALVRVALPAPALGALQSRSGNDIRVFDAQGQALPHALLSTPSAAPIDAAGARVPALPLQAQAASGSAQLSARVDVRSHGNGGVQHLQLQWSGTGADPTALQAAVFDLRAVKGLVSSVDLGITLPDNTPVHLQASLSKTLQQWQSVPTTGPVYRFAGSGAPSNLRLQFSSPQQVQDQFLLLQWPASAQVKVQALQLRTVSAAPTPAMVEVGLPPGDPARSGKGLEWTLPPGAHVASVQWSLTQPNQLRTYQLQGRRATSPGSNSTAAWESLGSVVVYHLQQGANIRHNAPHPLPAGDWRTLRLTDWPSGDTPVADGLQAKLQLQPVTLAFLANGQAPYTLAVGRSDTPAAALPAATLTTAAATPPDTWPLAGIGAAVSAPNAQAKRFADRWRYFLEDSNARAGFLWLVLGAAVLALGAVALKLLRSNRAAADSAAPPSA
ncbi:DUF3999 family protein [Curvibacter sp. APW13]|uniref:DUF3999 family protein n=1 Tax=Curvibacter sp. APW13 TaxID=3077236 RepID=UPI0028DF8A0C|nr:DUF3999 family protein [Curvibacter sp. APW13]MDT8991367.1 DUF3999 family protein [Curvibacter sp. APW13]